MPEPSSLQVSRAADRFHTTGDGVETWHSFSYGAHYDPDRIAFGPVMAINTEHVAPGRGYDLHDHADVEIVTWVLHGVLRHEDSTGQAGEVRPGTAQRLSAGTGVQHAERNASDVEPLVFVQMMLRSDHDGPPAYAQVDVDPVPGELTPTVGVQAPAELLAVRLEAGQGVSVPGAPRSLVLVTGGTIRCGDVELAAGDEARLTAVGEYDLRASSAATALIWQLQR
ncbi:pirin family protein [Aeromicrobium chenweiae]|uniref:Pirin family protein n=1 Tax=Aeromicrobium chenweiae TaxID=2079793 RepID=A0A2S0WIG5_9ACTN|nr:pirin family protein [Aeromicrobium chenweiae]AWB91123.1 pirin family protein [Aeromicrobium chenweiae]TGN31642.1 pirin family protein [Aeromicrobium chenweiae]